MPYTHFDPTRPDVAALGATRKGEIDKTRANFDALQDVLAALLMMDAFDGVITASGADGPTQYVATNANQKVKVDITYGSGPTAGLVTAFTFSKSVDTGANYDQVRTCTITYDVGEYVSHAWT